MLVTFNKMITYKVESERKTSGILDGYNKFADKVIGKELDVGNAFLEALGRTVGKAIIDGSIYLFDTLTFYLPEILGMTTFVFAALLMFGFKPHKMILIYASTLGGAILWRMFT